MFGLIFNIEVFMKLFRMKAMQNGICRYDYKMDKTDRLNIGKLCLMSDLYIDLIALSIKDTEAVKNFISSSIKDIEPVLKSDGIRECTFTGTFTDVPINVVFDFKKYEAIIISTKSCIAAFVSLLSS